MAIGQALLIKPPKPKAALQQQNQYQRHQRQEFQQVNKSAVLQEQSLKFEQSLELVQTLLGASIGCLSFLRGLLPEECFVEKRYGGKSSAAISYHSFTSDIEDETFKKPQPSSGTRVKRLRRGYSGEADQLLDWLEIGIFDALKMGYLKAVQLAIYVDKEHPDIIVESYTFSFSYRDKSDGDSTISLRVTDINGHGVTVEDANKNLQLMMRRLIVITQNLPPLPDQRWLTIRLHYLDHTPSNYDPPSFVRVSEKSPALKFHENETKEVEKLDVGGLNAGFHVVSLKISSSNDTDNQERPRRRRGSRFVHADVDIEALQFVTDRSQPSARIHTSGAMESQLGPATNEHAKLRDKHSILRNQVTDIAPIPNRRVTEITGRDTQEKMFLRGMLRQATRENDIIATQPLSLTIPRASADGSQLVPPKPNSPLAPLHDSEVLSDGRRPTIISGVSNSDLEPMSIQPELSQQQDFTPPKKQDHLGKVLDTGISQRQSPRKKIADNQEAPAVLENPPARVTNALEFVGKNMAKLKLSRAKTTELKRKGKRPNKGVFKGAGNIIDQSTSDTKGSQDHVNCECGYEKFEEDMICCDNCDEWQHTDCYGFDSTQDTRIPDYHVCYSCLLGKNEGKLLEEMRNMALFRRALKIIWRQGGFPSSNKAFATKLGCDLPTALQITRRLENEGFIFNTVKAKLHKKKVYKVVKTDDTKKLMETEYFDPLKKISHHFENPTSPNIIRESLLEDTSLTGPPSNTVPASLMNTMVEDSQPEQVKNPTEETIAASRPKMFSHMTDVDMESTADEEDDTPVQRTTPNISGHRESVMGHFRYSTRFNTTNPGHRNPVAKQRLPFEIAESPEPIQIYTAGEAQVLGDVITRLADAEPGRPRMNIGGATQDIFVGEELGDRRF